MSALRTLITLTAAALLCRAAPTASVLTIHTVTNGNDSGPGSLRQAIIDSNFDIGPSRIVFDGPHFIQPLTELPTPPAETNITGSTQLNASGEPLVTIDGSLSGIDTVGLSLQNANCAARNVRIQNFEFACVFISGAGNCAVTNCRITGSERGIYVGDAPNNRIGGSTAAERNVIGNCDRGIIIGFAGATGNVVQGNYVGTDSTGMSAVPNGVGIRIAGGATGNQIGGSAAGQGNLVSGNSGTGVHILNTSFNCVQGNVIGLAADGETPLGNETGVDVEESPFNAVGGLDAGSGNVIAGNTLREVRFRGVMTTESQLHGNLIGLNQAGTAAVGPAPVGVLIDSTGQFNFIGGQGPITRNVIAGRSTAGIHLLMGGSTLISNNFIGLATDGATPLGNGAGILIDRSVANVVGLTNDTIPEGVGNVISGNTFHQIRIEGAGADQNVIRGNLIGTDATGMSVPVLGQRGIAVSTGPAVNLIGGDTPEVGNVISGNSFGIFLGASSATTVSGNLIGLAADGVTPLGNGFGILISASAGNVIGSLTPAAASGARNVIASCEENAIVISGTEAMNNVVRGNLIGLDASGTQVIGNGGTGVFVEDAPFNDIGGQSDGDGNVIAGSGRSGVIVADLSNNVLISRNAIFGNTGLGIDLGNDGVTANDASRDIDTGPNLLQNFPIITQALDSNGLVEIRGLLHSEPQTMYTIEFYTNEETDPSGHGEGRHFAGSIQVLTDAEGNAMWELSKAGSLPPGAWITATTIGPDTNTSEFSAHRRIIGRGQGPSIEEILFHLLGHIPDPGDFDVNGDGTVDAADLVEVVNAAPPLSGS